MQQKFICCIIQIIMKKSMKVLAVSFLFLGSALTSCSTPEEKIEDARNNVDEANRELDDSKEHLWEVENYKAQHQAQIEENERSIAEFNARIDSQKKEARADYKKKIAELDAKNTDMKKRMDDFNSDNKAGWERFKEEFNHDMEALGDAFRDLGEDNKK